MKKLFLIDVLVAGPCNYDCCYCYLNKKTRKRKGFGKLAAPEGREELLRIMNELGECEVSLCGTGEASLIPNFFDLCEAITKKNYLTLITNFSFSDEEFIGRVPPERVLGLIISLHPKHEEDIDSFFRRIERYKKRGYPVAITYVTHPLRIKNIPRLYDRFTKIGVEFRVAPFGGMFKGRGYPRDFSEDEKKTILSYTTLPSAYHSLLRGLRLHKGKPCNAGHRSFYLDDKTGDILRCPHSRAVLGKLEGGSINIWDKAYPCDSYLCGCSNHAEEERAVDEYFEKMLDGKDLPRIFTEKDAQWYMPLCEPIWKEYEGAFPDLFAYDVRYFPDSFVDKKGLRRR